jgi:acyl carrier protein
MTSQTNMTLQATGVDEVIRDIVTRIAEIDRGFADDVNLRDGLGIDSYREVEILFEIEHVLGIQIPMERYSEVQTFDNLRTLVAALKN